MKRIAFFCLAGTLLATPPMIAQNDALSDKTDEDSWLDGALRSAFKTYERARDSGGKVAGDFTDWVKADLKKSAAWHYKIVDVKGRDAKALEKTLNDLGKERWECFSVQTMGVGRKTTRFFLRRREISYLRSLPADDLIRLAPLIGGGETSGQ